MTDSVDFGLYIVGEIVLARRGFLLIVPSCLDLLVDLRVVVLRIVDLRLVILSIMNMRRLFLKLVDINLKLRKEFLRHYLVVF